MFALVVVVPFPEAEHVQGRGVQGRGMLGPDFEICICAMAQEADL